MVNSGLSRERLPLLGGKRNRLIAMSFPESDSDDSDFDQM